MIEIHECLIDRLWRQEQTLRMTDNWTPNNRKFQARRKSQRWTKAAEIEKLQALIQCLLDNDPNDLAADGITVLDVWRKEARRALEPKP
jgi:hypothetical protein